ncbi:MAG: hypothetical protein AAB392_03400 [Patescibacteria group bacterium]
MNDEDKTKDKPNNKSVPELEVKAPVPTPAEPIQEVVKSAELEPKTQPTQEVLESVQVEKMDNPSTELMAGKTIEKKGDTITITEVITPPNPLLHQEGEPTTTAFPTPFKQKDLWQKFLEKLGMRKRKRLDKILEFLDKNTSTSLKLRGTGRITNDDVEKLLHVSDATATRYLNILEKEGKIKQIGKTGRNTYYEKI